MSKFFSFFKSFFNEASTDLVVAGPSQRLVAKLLITLAACLMLFILSAFFVRIDEAVRSPGIVISENGSKPAIARSSGYVHLTKSKMNDQVSAGEVFGEILIDQLHADDLLKLKADLENLSKQLQTRARGITEKIEKPYLFIDKISQADLSQPLIEIDKEFSNLQGKLKSIKTQKTQDLRVLQQRREKLAQNLKILKKSKNAKLLEFQIESIENELNEVNLRMNDRKVSLTEKFDDSFLALQRNIHTAISKIDQVVELHQIRSPINGKIVKIENAEQSFVSLGVPVAWILSIDDPVLVELHVPTNQLGKVLAGQSVFFKLESYPYTKYGTFLGNIIWVETPRADSIDRDYFIARSTISKPQYNRGPASNKSVVFRPGMKSDSSIVIENKKIIEIFRDKIFN
mgnify:CR=1 FL=1